MSEKDFGTNPGMDQNTTMKSNQDGQESPELRRTPDLAARTFWNSLTKNVASLPKTVMM